MKEFVHLHVHSEYSLLDGAARIVNKKGHNLRKACEEKGMKAVAVTDHGNMMGSLSLMNSFYNETEFTVKPIIGTEVYTCSDMTVRNNERYHLVLLAKNLTGYKNLMKISSLGYCEGFYSKPRVDLQAIAKYSDGLICLSGCLAGKVIQLLLLNDYEGAVEYAQELKSIFDDGDFYIELQDHNIPEQQATNPLLVKLAREIGVKVVATNDAHYLERDDAEMHDLLLCIQTGTKLNDEKRMRFTGEEFYLKTYDEMYEVFHWIPEALDNTIEIADKCNVKINMENNPYLIPKFDTPNGETPNEYLAQLCWEGIYKKFKEVTPEIIERVNYELDTIISMKFAEYYLIVWDYINYAKSKSIPVGPGRGSGVGSIVAYATGITDVDPIKYSLIFERFLNKERLGMPDFDIDFCFVEREKVIKYVVEKYGANKVSQIITFGTMSAKAALKDVARVYDVPYNDANTWAKLVPEMTKDKLGDMIVNVVDIRSLYNSNPLAKKVIDMAIKIEGMPRQTGKHAAGVVMCCDKIDEHTPLAKRDGDITTQYNMGQIESLGLIKMDFLGLKTLTDIKYGIDYIRANRGITVDFNEVGYNDQKVFEFIGAGNLVTIFQLESGGMTNFMSRLKPTSIEDLTAGVSLYRPGPLQFIDKFIMGKFHPEQVAYLHPILESILDVTYGCIVYQEQVMQIAREVAGYSFGGADILRRAMGKKKAEIMAANMMIFVHGDGKLVEGAIKRGVPEDIAKVLWEQIVDFAQYAFNKSHAAAYATISYQTAYLKCYFPVEFTLAVINNRITNADEVSHYINHLKDIGYEVLPPNINKSSVKFVVEDGNKARFGMMGIKNVGEGAMTKMVEERTANGEFKDLYDFVSRIVDSGINKRAIECMIKGGAMDCFGHTRATLMASYEVMIDVVTLEKKNINNGQVSMFEMFADDEALGSNSHIISIPEYSKRQLLSYEKEVIGMYISGHPLEDYKKLFNEFNFNTTMIRKVEKEDNLLEEDEQNNIVIEERVSYNNKSVYMAGLLLHLEKKISKKNGSNMLLGALEDLYGTINIICFGKVYDKYKDILVNDRVVKIRGVISERDDNEVTLRINEVIDWDDISLLDKKIETDQTTSITNNQTSKKIQNQEQDYSSSKGILCIRLFKDDQSLLDKVIRSLKLFRGKNKVYCQINNQLNEMSEKVEITSALIWEMEAMLGDENVKVKK